MEKRTLLAVALCLGVWLVWLQFVMPHWFPPVPKPVRTTTFPTQETLAGPAVAPVSPSDVVTPAAPAAESMSNAAAPATEALPELREEIARQTENYEIVFSNRGAQIRELRLRKFRNSKGTDLLQLLDDRDPSVPSFAVTPGAANADFAGRLWNVVADEPGHVAFETVVDGRLRITKTYLLGTGYTIRLRMRFENLDATPQTWHYTLAGAAGVEPEPGDELMTAGVRGIEMGTRVKVLADTHVKDVVEHPRDPPAEDKSKWAGSVNKFFAALVIPRTEGEIDALSFHLVTNREKWAEFERTQTGPVELKERTAFLMKEGHGNVQAVIRSRPVSIEPGKPRDVEYELFIGPKDRELLGTFEKDGLIGLLDFGWFGSISFALLWVLGIFHGIVGNYGWSIVLLTIAVRLSLFPLNRKSQVAMFRLQKLQPKINTIREKHGKDAQKMNLEMMGLYKEHGVNPFSGCLPMFIQLPVLVALYWALQLSIELRQAPWLLWVGDLSQPDVLCALPFKVLGQTQLHLLPLLMTATWFIQQMLAPKSPDPQVASQQKMFMFMPILFGIMMYWTPSGLILYWFTSTLIGIGEQQLIKKVFIPRAA